MENIVMVVQEMSGQLCEARKTINGIRNELRNTQGGLKKINYAWLTLQAGKSAGFGEGRGEKSPKLRKPACFSGKGSVSRWITHVDNYISDVPQEKSVLNICQFFGCTCTRIMDRIERYRSRYSC